MIRILSIFLLLLAAVWLGIQLHHDPGYLLIAINKWTVETTLWVAIISLLLLFLFLHFFMLLCSWMVHFPAAWRNWSNRRRMQKAQAKTRQGLIEFSEGYWQRAKNHLIKALPDTDTPLLNYLTAARAAQEMGDSKLRDEYLRQAQQSVPDAKIAVELTQAQLQLANRQWEQALATLKHLQDLVPNHPYVLKLLMHLYEEVRDWPQLLALLPELQKNHVISLASYKRLQQHAYLHFIADLAKQNQTQLLNDTFNNLPKRLSHDPELVAEYSRYLLSIAEYAQAENLLRRVLQKHFNDELINLYGQIKSEDANLNFAESLIKTHPHSACLYLCLGRLCINKQLWGKARAYLEESIAYGATPAAYAELGKLLENLNDSLAACSAYRKGLLLVVAGERVPG